MKFKEFLSEAEMESKLNWKNKKPMEYYGKLVSAFGEPYTCDDESCKWKDIDGFDLVILKDESVDHPFPVAHKDYVYSTKKLDIPPRLHDELAKVTGSILIDGLKKEVTARCHMLVKNAVTLGFVEDVVAGRTKPTKDEYKKRIMNNIVPKWFKDSMGEV